MVLKNSEKVMACQYVIQKENKTQKQMDEYLTHLCPWVVVWGSFIGKYFNIHCTFFTALD